MQSNKNLTIPKILIIYIFISLLWHAVFSYASFEINYIGYLKWSSIVVSFVWFSRVTENHFGRTFDKFIGKVPNKSELLNLVGIFIIYLLIGIGSNALLILVESSIDIDYALNKWGFISASKFAEIIWDPYWMTIMLLTSIIIVPITEELVFRGFVLNRLREKYSPIIAVVISALIFGLAHLNKGYISAFFHGIILALIAIKYASLYYPLIVHGLYNGISLISQKYWGIFYVADTEKINSIEYWLPEIVCLILGISLSIIYFNKLFKSKDIEYQNL